MSAPPINRFVVTSPIVGHGALKDAYAHVSVATEARAQQLVEEGARAGITRTYRALSDREIDAQQKS